MPFTNKPFVGGQDENPLVKTPYYVTWNDDVLLPPPGSGFIITEIGEHIITETGDNLIIE